MEEIWRDIPGHEGRYAASNLGRIKSLPREQDVVNRFGTVMKKHYKEKVLKPAPSKVNSGHLYVALGRNNNTKTIHSLVLLAFIGPRPKGSIIRHKDGDPTNNCLSNLCYGTYSENLIDAYKLEERKRSTGPEKARVIKQLLDDGSHKGKDIAKMLGVSETTVSSIKRGRTYKWA